MTYIAGEPEIVVPGGSAYVERSVVVGNMKSPAPAAFKAPSPYLKLIAFTGQAGVGKSTAAQHLVDAHGFVRVRFAGPLKRMMAAVGLGESEIDGEFKEWPSELLCGKTPRYAMQTLGTEWGRECIGGNFWTGLWARVARDVLDHGGRVVVDDCRFDNEVEVIRSFGGKVFKLTGRGGIAGEHASEAGCPFDLDIANDNEPGALYAEIDRMLAA